MKKKSILIAITMTCILLTSGLTLVSASEDKTVRDEEGNPVISDESQNVLYKT